MTIKTRNYLIIAITFTVVSILCWQGFAQYYRGKEEAEVYWAIFEPNPFEQDFEQVIAISQPIDCGLSSSYFDYLPNDVISDYQTRNIIKPEPIRLIGLQEHIPVLSWEETKILYSNEVIHSFHPDGHSILRLSRVGFNFDHDEAIACFELATDTYSRSDLFFLQQNKDEWHVVKTVNIWFS